MYQYPQGNAQHLNLDWFLKRWEEFRAEWVNAEANIDHALDAEIARVDAAMANLYAARDAAIAAKDDAVIAKNAAAGSATAAYGSQTSAASSAASAMTNALKSEGHAVGEQNGNPVSSGSAYYQNNSKYYANQAAGAVTDAQQEVANAHTEAENAAASAQHAQDLVDTLPSDYSDLLHQVGKQIEGDGTELTGAMVSFDDGVEGVPVRKLTVNIEPVQSGSGDPSPNNIRPITGWTEANVTKTGKNLLAKPFFVKYTGASLPSFSDSFFVKAGAYYISWDVTNATSWRLTIRMWDKDGNYASSSEYRPAFSGYNLTWYPTENLWRQGANNDSHAGTIVFQKDCYVCFGVSVGDLTPSSSVLNAQLELGTVQTTYEAYQGETYNIDFPAGAGTVYGGTLKNNGTDIWKLTVTMANIASYNGETINEPWLSSMDAYTSGATPTTGAQVVYTLTNPITYTLTNEQAVTLLKGTNNVWADTGDVTLTYGAYLSVLTNSIQAKLNKTTVAPVLSDMVADAALSVNDLRIVGDTLYKVTANIANGGTLTVGTNVIATTIGEEITALLNA